MGKVMRCPACSSYYNGAIYSSCPYCNGTSESADSGGQKHKRGKGLHSLLGKKSGIKVEKQKKESSSHNSPGSAQADMNIEHIPSSHKPGSTRSSPSAPPEDSVLQSPKIIQPTVGMEGVLSQKETPPGEHTHTQKTAQKQAQGQDPTAPPALTLSQAVNLSGRKTVGKYVGNLGESIMPVVGWLVCVKGAYYGQSFSLKSGRNRIGRAHDMDIKLLNDDSVSRSSVAVIIFEPKSRGFSIIAGESDSLCYVDGKPLYDNDRCTLRGYEEIEFGDQELNKFVFLPLCGERFHWPKNTSENGLDSEG